MTDPIEQLIHIHPAIWPTKNIKIRPGDLRHFAPPGRASQSLVPGGELDAAAGRPADLFLSVPPTESVGGIIFIHDQPRTEDLAALLRLLRIEDSATDYAAFLERAADPAGAGYVTQVRIVRSSALVGLYGALSLDEMRFFPHQALSIGDLLPAFVAGEKARWTGGPSLGFGLMVENAHYGVYRLFSRIWRPAD